MDDYHSFWSGKVQRNPLFPCYARMYVLQLGLAHLLLGKQADFWDSWFGYVRILFLWLNGPR